MSVKNYGPGVSGFLDPDGRAWETTVFQSGKPVLDKELNLEQDSEQGAELGFRRRTLSSGWIRSEFLDTSDMTSGIFLSPGQLNVGFPQDMLAHVNGWLVRVANTFLNFANLQNVSVGPAGAGTKRTDIVILEVWRRLLSASPSTDGKSPAGRIWRYGNVKVAPGDDLTLNFADDILDGAVGSETTKRVQIQYRLRVIDGVDILAFPYGLDDPSVFAHSVPPNAATYDGTATAFNYVNQSAAGDPGLWVAGDGNPANTLGTVDGYMYAIPLAGVLRRNTTAFDRNTNHNGGSTSPAPSDRPDGLNNDIIVATDMVDLRLGVSPTGWNYQEVLEKNFNWLLDNVLQTELTQTTIGGGVRGHIHLWADEIGITNAHGGDGVTTGDTPGAAFIGEFDAVRRRFSDRAMPETVVCWFQPADGSGGGPNWAPGDTITIDPTALKLWGYAPFNWASYAPANVTIMGIADAHYIAPIGTTGGLPATASTGAYSVTGLGAVPMTSLTVRIDNVPTGITNEWLFIRLEVCYPTGVGLSKTETSDFDGASVSINNPGQLPAAGPVFYESIDDLDFVPPHREVMLAYHTVTQIWFILAEQTIPIGPYPVTMPERVESVSQVLINAVLYVGSISIDQTGYLVLLDSGSVAPGDTIEVHYKALRPFPQNDEQLTIYYNAMAPQASRTALLGTTLSIIPRYISPFLYVLAAGSGSPDEAYPFPTEYVQMPGIYPTSGGTFSGDHELASSAEMVTSTFTGTSGFLKLETLIPVVPNPNGLTLLRDPGDVDSEGRSFFKSIPALTYLPNAFSQSLSSHKRHRCVLPMICELTADSPLGFKGQLVMVVIGSYFLPDILGSGLPLNYIAFDSTLAQNFTSASVYRIKGNLLNRRSM